MKKSMKKSMTIVQKYRMAQLEMEDVSIANARYDKERKELASWADPEDKRLLANQQNAKKRDDLLNRVVPSKECPGCGKIILSRRSWVVKDGQCVCRSCWSSGNVGEGAGGKMTMPIVKGEPTTTVTYPISGLAIEKARRLARLSINRFADLCEWRAAYQLRLERGDIRSISLEKLRMILKILNKFGVETIDKHGL